MKSIGIPPLNREQALSILMKDLVERLLHEDDETIMNAVDELYEGTGISRPTGEAERYLRIQRVARQLMKTMPYELAFQRAAEQ